MTITALPLRSSELGEQESCQFRHPALLDLAYSLQVTADKSVAPGEKVSQFHTTDHIEPIS